MKLYHSFIIIENSIIIEKNNKAVTPTSQYIFIISGIDDIEFGYRASE